jgi:NADH-quinone oxidoreductase subunit M
MGRLPDRWASWPDLGLSERAVLGPMLALVIVIGVVPAWLLDVIHRTATAMVGRP